MNLIQELLFKLLDFDIFLSEVRAYQLLSIIMGFQTDSADFAHNNNKLRECPELISIPRSLPPFLNFRYKIMFSVPADRQGLQDDIANSNKFLLCRIR